MKIMSSIEMSDFTEYIIGMRREFHMYPEGSFQEHRTSKRILEELKKMNIECKRVGETGVVGIIKGVKNDKTVALRADMDALELKEMNETVYKSRNEGMMHACGHDGHSAMLLGAAKILTNNRHRLGGNVLLIFQPAEEVVAGAKALIEEGVLEGVDSILGIHLWSGIETGKISVQEGPRMASGDAFEINIKGKGGHGSMPHDTVDSIVAGAAIVQNLQSIVSRELNPMEPAVVSVGVFRGGSRFNVIAQDAKLEGTVRCYSHEIRNKFPEMLTRISKNIAATYGAEAQVVFTPGVPPTINHGESVKIAVGSIEKLFGSSVLINQEKSTGGEDMAYYLEKVPGLLAFVGCRNEAKGITYPHHHPKFDIDEDSLNIGTCLYVQYALDFLDE